MQGYARLARDALLGTGRDRSRLRPLALALAVAALLAIRYPSVVATPRFLAEEGDIFFANAWFLHGAEALWANLTPRLGYLNFYPIFVTWLAAKLVPLEIAPSFVLIAIALVQGAGLALVLAGPRRDLASPLQRAAAAGVLLYFPYYNGLSETWLSVMNAPVHFGVVALLLLLSDEPRESRAGRLAGRALLGFGAATGPYTLLLLPLFALKWLHTREPEVRRRTLLMAAVAIVQLTIALSAFAAGRVGETRNLGDLGPNSWYVAVVFQVLYAITGEIPAQLALGALDAQPGPWIGWTHAVTAILLATALLGSAWAVAARTGTRHYLLMAVVLTSCFTVLFSVNGLPGYRYVVCPSSAIGLLLVHAAASAAKPAARTFFGGLAAAGIASGILEALLVSGPMTSGNQAHWPAEVAQWRRDPDHRLKVWPSHFWFTNLADPVRRDALEDALAMLPAKLEIGAGRPPTVVVFERGLPAYFAVGFEVCATHAGTLDLAGRSEAGAAAFNYRVAIAEGCGPARLNSMHLAFSGFRDFSAITRLELSLDGPAGSMASLSRIATESPVLSVAHPWSGD